MRARQSEEALPGCLCQGSGENVRRAGGMEHPATRLSRHRAGQRVTEISIRKHTRNERSH